MLRNILVLLDRSAVSFCNYATPSSDEEWIAKEHLRYALHYAIRHRLTLNCVLGTRPLPDDYESMLNLANHVKFLPVSLSDLYPHAIVIIDQPARCEALPPLPQRNVILRLSRIDLHQLTSAVAALLQSVGRINLHLLDLQSYTDFEIRVYQEQLENIVALLREHYYQGGNVEVSFLSDRIMHKKMRNCNAGSEHLTLAPNGLLYPCPGFYYDGAPSLGDLKNGWHLPNAQLYQLDHAPICEGCDAYHCKRCVYLNRSLTGEINTPSWQQCVTAHAERNASSRLLASLSQIPLFRKTKPFNELKNLDPFSRLVSPPKPPPVQVRDGYRLVTLPPLRPIRPRSKVD